jgi:hypothetical protein
LAKLLTIDPDVLRRLRGLPKNDRVECLLALCEMTEAFGQPHRHGGIGIRKLAGKLFECRPTLSLRLLFQDRPGELYAFFLGTHDDVRALLRRGTYR